MSWLDWKQDSEASGTLMTGVSLPPKAMYWGYSGHSATEACARAVCSPMPHFFICECQLGPITVVCESECVCVCVPTRMCACMCTLARGGQRLSLGAGSQGLSTLFF